MKEILALRKLHNQYGHMCLKQPVYNKDLNITLWTYDYKPSKLAIIKMNGCLMGTMSLLGQTGASSKQYYILIKIH